MKHVLSNTIFAIVCISLGLTLGFSAPASAVVLNDAASIDTSQVIDLRCKPMLTSKSRAALRCSTPHLYRVRAKCRAMGPDYNVYGSWVRGGATSVAKCHSKIQMYSVLPESK